MNAGDRRGRHVGRFILPGAALLSRKTALHATAATPIAFFWVGPDTTLPALLVQSARLAFGNEVAILQLTDKTTAEVTGVSKVSRSKLSDRLMVARLEAYAHSAIATPTLFLDADMLVVQPFTLPALQPDDVGVTVRDDDVMIRWKTSALEFPEFEGRSTRQEMPFIYSFVYTASEVLFIRQLNALKKMPKRFHLWYGDQVTLKRELDSDRYRRVEFETRRYNRTVRSDMEFRGLLDAEPDVNIAHFKGPAGKPAMMSSMEALVQRHAASAGHV